MKTILITGSEGFVGKSLKEYFKSRGYRVIGLDIAQTSDINADISSSKELTSKLKELDVEIIIHLAAIANIPSCLADPFNCLYINCVGTLNMLEAAKNLGVDRFIYASSANVYGARPKLPVTEDAELSPRTPYDYSKVAAEQLVMAYHRSKGLPVVIFRSWKLFGEYDSPSSVVSRFIDACLKNEAITLYNRGADVTDPYHVDNYAKAVELSINSDKAVGEIFNVGTGSAISIRQLAEMIRELTMSNSRLVEMPPRTAAEAEPMISYPSIEKIKNILGYEPIVSLTEGLKRVINHRRKLLNGT
ncbi:MAG: NAD-dependent epimerase/dehydratase family protein [Nitrososphaerota archaeon]